MGAVVLYDFPRSSASYRVRIALNLCGLAYERRTVDIRAGEQDSPAFLAVNPQGLVPSLQVDGQTITQSFAIIDYLDRHHPQVGLIPEDPATRATALAMAQIIMCDIHPLNNLRVLRHLEAELGVDTDARDVWYARWVSSGFHAIETMLAGKRSEIFCVGSRPGIVDLSLVPQVFNARRFNVDLTPFPLLCAKAAAAEGHPAFQTAHPDQLS